MKIDDVKEGLKMGNLAYPRTEEEIRYAELWVEVELPKLLNPEEMRE